MSTPSSLISRFSVVLTRSKDVASLEYEVDLFKASNAQEIIAQKMGKQLKDMEKRRRDEPFVEAQTVEWRALSQFPNYELSNDGRLRRATNGSNARKGTIIHARIGATGYPQYNLMTADGSRKTVTAHRLVALAYLPPPLPGQAWVLHRNDNKLDARAANLRWGTEKENSADAMANGRIRSGELHSSRLKPWTRPYGERHPSAKLTETAVRAIFGSADSAPVLARAYGVDSALIYRIKRGQIWKHVTNPTYAAFLAAEETRSPMSTPRRKRLSTRQLLKLLERENHQCHICFGGIKAGDAWDVSHETPLALGGEDSEENRRAAHRACHRTHTAKVDIPAIAKAKRNQARHLGARRSRTPLPGGRDSPWKKKISGEVVRRDSDQ